MSDEKTRGLPERAQKRPPHKLTKAILVAEAVTGLSGEPLTARLTQFRAGLFYREPKRFRRRLPAAEGCLDGGIEISAAEYDALSNLDREQHALEVTKCVYREAPSLVKARVTAREKKTGDAGELHRLLRKAAFDYWCTHPLADQGDVIIFLRRGDFGHRTEKTIARLIAGVRSEVKEKLQSSPVPKADLYATGQKRNR